MDRRPLIGFFLILLVWMAFLPKGQPPEDASSVSADKTVAANSAEEANSESPKTGKSSTAVARERQGAHEVPNTLRTLENDHLQLVFASRQAGLKEVLLKDYKKEKRAESQWVNLAADGPANLVLFSLAMKTPAAGTEANQNAVIFPLNEFQEVSFNEDGKEILYDMKVPGKFHIERSYKLEEKDYSLWSKLRITNSLENAPQKIQVGTSWQAPVSEAPRRMFGPPPDMWQPMALLGQNDLHPFKVRKGETSQVQGAISWAALSNRYFIMAYFPLWEGLRELEVSESTTTLQNTLWSHQLTIAPGESADLASRIFLGPKEVGLLETQGKHLDRAMNLGMFEIVAMPLLKLLRFFDQFLGNWGLAIIALTFVVKLVLFPLTHKSFKSMKEMQRIQPLLNDLREKYKNDKEQLNVQMMKMMREHKVNPLGGCLPMVFQFPIWIALYRVLYTSIELRHAPFYFWIHDLSARDPYFISPVLLGVLMFVQQRMSPKPPDPMQAKMTMLMPIMFSVFMLFLPSGLVIYIFTNTLLSILQQWHINKSLDMKVFPVDTMNAQVVKT